MRRITYWILSTVAILVLLFSYRTSTSIAPATASAVATAAGTAPTSSAAGTSTAASTSSGAAATGQTYTGSAVSTRYGPVQVAITVANGKITGVTVVQVPMSNGRDQQINSAAVPVLTQETVAAQSSTINLVSGATYTSDGYVQSLQSAIDQAHLS